MVRLRVKHWVDDLYGVGILLLHGPHTKAGQWLDTTMDIDATSFGAESGGKTLFAQSGEDGDALIFWFPPGPVPGHIIAHECLHGTFIVLQTRGLTLDNSSDEAYAYHLAWLFRQLQRRLNGNHRA